MSEQARSEQACPVCSQHTLALDRPPDIDVMGVQQYSDMPFVVRDVPGFSVFESPPPAEDAKLRFVLFNQPVDPSLLVATTYLYLLDNLKTDEHVGILLRGGAVTADGTVF